MKNHALVLIDFQNDYFEGGLNPLNESFHALHQAKKVVDFFRYGKMPVIHIRHESIRPDSSFFLPMTHGAEIHDLLTPLHNETVFTKHHPNSFLETGLIDLLRVLEIKKLVFCGMMTHMCVDATVRAAKDYGFECFLIGDACATKNLVFNNHIVEAIKIQHAFLAALSGVYAQVFEADHFIALHNNNKVKL